MFDGVKKEKIKNKKLKVKNSIGRIRPIGTPFFFLLQPHRVQPLPFMKYFKKSQTF